MADSQRDNWIRFLAGNQLGPYALQAYRGGGEYGLVFDAMDTRNDKDLALKILAPGARSMDMVEFEEEGRLLRKLNRSSSVVGIYDSAEVQVTIDSARGVAIPFRYHALERAEDCLETLLIDARNRRSLDWQDKLKLWRGAVRGIHQMHIKGCVHRDIKSSNCLLFVRPRNVTECKVSDLGKARDLAEQSRLPPEKYLMGRGDFRFAPPEFLFLQGADDELSFKLGDLYGLGSLLFEIATGQGITGVALGFGPRLVRTNLRDYQAGVRTDLSGLRPQYAKAFSLLAPELPSSIRFRTVSLVKQLCDPVPAMRVPRTVMGRRRWSGPGLEWLLRQADIMIRSTNVPRQRQPMSRVGGRTL
ncbi:protein kinase domain-containing protein [Micromonospora sp. DT227]|uniref:protein kinase domain-containing protein n=1 Tax=Micromonospora sp. DT227 TaxID=3393433 RepID=UPI003CF12F6B